MFYDILQVYNCNKIKLIKIKLMKIKLIGIKIGMDIEIMKDKSTRFALLPADIKQMILASLFLSPVRALEIIDKCNNGDFSNLICDNRFLFDTLWLKYVRGSIDKKYKKMVMADFRKELEKRMNLYKKNAIEIFKYDDFNDEIEKKENIVYTNVKNIIELITMMHIDASYDMDKFIKTVDKLTYIDQNVTDLHNLLTMACFDNDYKAVKLLIEKGANVNVILGGYTPLLYASYNDNFEIVKLLVNNGANINHIPKSLIISPALIVALKSKNKEIYDFLIDNGADIFIKNSKNQTTLLAASEGNDLDLIKFLIEKGLDVNEADKDGNTHFLVSSMFNPLIKQYLIDNGAY